MEWLGLGRRPSSPYERTGNEQARQRLLDQERRLDALDRVVEVIQRDAPEDRPHAAE